MKQKLLKTLLLLSALVVGLGNAWADTYQLVTSTSALVAGGEYLIVNTAGTYAAGATSTTSTKYATTVGVSVSDNKITDPSSDVAVYTLGGNSDGWTFNSSQDSKYLYWVSGNSLNVNATVSANTKWTIDISEGNATIANVATTERIIRFNSDRFACYTSNTGTLVKLYKKIPSYTITAQSNNNEYGTVSIEGTTITGSPNSGYRYATPAYTVTSGSATVSQDGNAFSVTPSSDCTVRINFEAIPTHTATFSINGDTSNSDTFAEGAAITFPVNPDAISGKTFVGWVTEAITGTADIEPSFVTSATMGTSDVTYYAVFATGNISSIPKTDNITRSTTGVSSGGGYSNWSGKTLTSTAVYSGCSAGGNGAIQLNATSGSSYRGIISTTSGGTLSKVTITWNTNTTSGRAVKVYGSNSAYTTMSAFNSSKGTELGSITYGTSTELSIDDDYEYIGFYAESAIYIDNIAIEWNTTETTYSAYCTTISVLPVPTITFYDENDDEISELDASSLNAMIPVSVTCSAGDVTLAFESSEETVAEYDEGYILTYAEGTTTITATFAGNGSYQGTSATLTVNVERGTTTLSFPATPETINIGATATYAATGSPAVSGITYSSSNTSVLTVNSATGEITGVAKGSATITASFAGNDDYKAAEESYTILVVNPNEITYTLTNSQIVSGGPEAATGYDSKNVTDENGKTWNSYAVKNYHSNATSSFHFLQIKAYDNTTASYIQVPAYGTRITELEMTVSGASQAMGSGSNGATIFFSADNTTKTTGSGVASGTGSSTVTIDCSALNLNTGYITASGAVRIWDVKVTYEYALPVGSALWTSHVTADAVDFTGVTAYIAKSVNAETISLEEVESAPANTPVIIEGTTQKTYYLQTKYSSLDDVSSNLLEASDGSVTGDGSTIFALGLGKVAPNEGKVGFYLVGDGETVPEGKAYLTVPAAVKEFLTFDFGFDDADGISLTPAFSEGEGEIYNLAGQRLQKMQKGINIVNGKKVLK